MKKLLHIMSVPANNFVVHEPKGEGELQTITSFIFGAVGTMAKLVFVLGGASDMPVAVADTPAEGVRDFLVMLFCLVEIRRSCKTCWTEGSESKRFAP